jgi:hypothetical protein
MRCPVVPTHTMIQIAPAVWQCPDCGAGPRLYFSLARVAIEEGSAEALQITWKPELDSYVLSDVFWEVNESGKRLPGSYESELLGYVSTTKELAQQPLPVISPTGDRCRLRKLMYEDPLGVKTYPRGAQSGRSAAMPAPARSTGRSRARRKTGEPRTTS